MTHIPFYQKRLWCNVLLCIQLAVCVKVSVRPALIIDSRTATGHPLWTDSGEQPAHTRNTERMLVAIPGTGWHYYTGKCGTVCLGMMIVLKQDITRVHFPPFFCQLLCVSHLRLVLRDLIHESEQSLS